MRIGFVSRGRLRAFKESVEKDCQEKTADILLFGFEGMGEVSYEKELKGESVFFEDAALLSKAQKSIVVCGCVTDTRGHKRKSAIVAENGRISGVSDMLNAIDGEIACGAALRIYDTKLGRMGVAVAEDIYFPEIVRSLAVCGCDFIVCPAGRVTDSLQSVLLRAYAYCYGVPLFFCGAGYGMIADGSGSVAFASPLSPVYTDFENAREYHLIETRKRGFFRTGM